ncbi:MAG: metallophosphoesterase family protein [Spirochaetales bacterium]|nr:metallophosphoesterase family protein [Spirochaetales bacterium]
MKILAVSDFMVPMFSSLEPPSRFQGVELILSCGDLPPEYLSSLAGAFQAPLYYVRGNHDRRTGISLPGGGSCIHAQVVRYRGLSILGLEGSRWYNGGPHQYTERQMRGFLRRARSELPRRERLDIVVAHAPPRDVGDAEDPCHQGFQSFRRLIERSRPRYFLHGHIHRRFGEAAERIIRIGDTEVINASGYHLLEVEEGASRG